MDAFYKCEPCGAPNDPEGLPVDVYYCYWCMQKIMSTFKEPMADLAIEFFNQWDKDKNGVLDHDELHNKLK